MLRTLLLVVVGLVFSIIYPPCGYTATSSFKFPDVCIKRMSSESLPGYFWAIEKAGENQKTAELTMKGTSVRLRISYPSSWARIEPDEEWGTKDIVRLEPKRKRCVVIGNPLAETSTEQCLFVAISLSRPSAEVLKDIDEALKMRKSSDVELSSDRHLGFPYKLITIDGMGFNEKADLYIDGQQCLLDNYAYAMVSDVRIGIAYASSTGIDAKLKSSAEMLELARQAKAILASIKITK